ncbi:NAD(P)H-quinone oxidoreductase subunit K 1 precursor [archaeon BMS3Abin16]|nr:NAD(P)H-quinone oxidoreductase subunit K 1 precursor [archaeon BMS3Abin16]GBE56152.1 NAD(P)H-quinone oxidoreductase subunit K 1 precursor [archaeon BMS3Bbin16]HDY74045.1 NADH-quinone oxidoreductase subunit B [Euryarchaeota archaeon]
MTGNEEQAHVIFAKKDDLLEVAQNTEKRKSFLAKVKRPVDYLFNWGIKSSLWMYAFGLACCSIEMMAFGAARWDSDRYGIIARGTPRQSDLMIVGGAVTYMMAPRMKRLYDQMAQPRYVIAMGECAINGGPFWDSYSVVKGADKVIPVDVYIPGCPANPEALFDGIIKLQDKILKGELAK